MVTVILCIEMNIHRHQAVFSVQRALATIDRRCTARRAATVARVTKTLMAGAFASLFGAASAPKTERRATTKGKHAHKDDDPIVVVYVTVSAWGGSARGLP